MGLEKAGRICQERVSLVSNQSMMGKKNGKKDLAGFREGYRMCERELG